MANDEIVSAPAAPSRRPGAGLAFAVVSALCFALSGPLARGLLDTGWNAAAVVLIRIGLAAVVLLPLGIAAMRGRWAVLKRTWPTLLVYGVLAVAGAQFCYFSAVAHMDVGPALLIEYTAPAAVVLWMWLRHGQRPGLVTVGGALLAALGLVLVLGLLSGGVTISTVGVIWSLCAMIGVSSYFLISADTDNGLPPLALAAGGLVIGALSLGVLALVGVLPLASARATTTYAGHEFPWWAPLLALGLVTAAAAYVLGIVGTRLLGSRLASFVALTEVVAAVVFAWLLLGQLPTRMQLVGGALILAGVIGVKLGEPPVATADA